MEMLINRLPGRTWNRLGMNESLIRIEGEIHDHTPELSGDHEKYRFTQEEQFSEGIRDAATGVGKETACLAVKSHVTVMTSEEAHEKQNPAIMTFSYGKEEKAGSLVELHAEKNSTLSLIMLLESEADAKDGIAYIQTKIHAEEGSRVHLYVAELLDSGFTCIYDVGGVCEDDAVVEITKLELGAGKLYTGATMDLLGRNSKFVTDLGYYCRKDQLMDMNYLALHHGEKTNSLMEISGTLEDGAKKVFRGTIDFQRGSKGARGTETENVLLLGDRVVNQTIPLILCKEEDVEGNHGASIGKLDDKVLFYLGTRGISEKDARQIMARSRIDAVCERIPSEEIREKVYAFEGKEREADDEGK